MVKARSAFRVTSAFLVFIAITGALAIGAPGRPVQPPAQSRSDADLSLEGHMKRVNRAFKTLVKQVGDPSKNESSLELVHTMETHFVAAKAKVPDMVKKAPEAKRAELVKTFRGQAIKAMMAILELEQQLLNGENAKAKETIEKIKALEKEGHRVFEVDEVVDE